MDVDLDFSGNVVQTFPVFQDGIPRILHVHAAQMGGKGVAGVRSQSAGRSAVHTRRGWQRMVISGKNRGGSTIQ
jgi:hypothetical protein